MQYNKTRCIGCYVICKIRFNSRGIDIPKTLNSIVYVGKGNLQRAASHFPKKRSNFKTTLTKLTKQQKALVKLLAKKSKIGVIALRCCHTAVAFACEKVLIKHFRSTLLNSYSGHKVSLPPQALNTLENAALEFLFSRISDCDFDLVY